MMMVPKQSRRRAARVWCGAPARAEGPRGPIRGICRNLSVGGLFFLGAPLEIGKSVDFVVELPSVGAIRAVGEVRYRHQYQEGSGVGVRFTRLSQEDLSRIEQFIAHPSQSLG